MRGEVADSELYLLDYYNREVISQLPFSGVG